MVSVQDPIKDTISPLLLSGPYSLKISKTSPVAAEEENIFTIAAGRSTEGKTSSGMIFPNQTARSVRKQGVKKDDKQENGDDGIGYI